MQGLGVYVHVPFCAAKCPYCDFYSIASEARKGEYVEAVLRELAALRGEFAGNALTLYFGGGTPSRLRVDELGRMVEAVQELYALEEGAEVTVEVNPDDASREFFMGLAALGVNRVSVGVQSVCEAVLKILGRRHGASQGLRAIELAKAAGINNVSGDVIYGIPGQREEEVRGTCEALVSAGCTHVSAYHLIVEEGTLFGRRHAEGKFREVEEETSLRHYGAVCEAMRRAGFSHYEVSSYALPGYESRHNSLYWRGGLYVGVGPGAHSYDGARRWWNVRSVKEYAERVAKGELPREVEVLDESARFEEWLLTGLRLAEGVDLLAGERSFGRERLEEVRRRAEGWAARGAVALEESRLWVREEGFMVLDAVVLDLASVE